MTESVSTRSLRWYKPNQVQRIFLSQTNDTPRVEFKVNETKLIMRLNEIKSV